MTLKKYRNELLKQSMFLRGKSLDVGTDYEKGIKIVKKQKMYYEKWKFFDNYIKQIEKMKKGEIDYEQ